MHPSTRLVVAILIFAENDEVCGGLSMFGLDLDYMPVQISTMKMMKCVGLVMVRCFLYIMWW